MVHGGRQPIVGAHVYLLALNATGYGGPGIPASSSNASLSLLTSASGTAQDGSGNYYVTTDANGNFTITGDYSCPADGSLNTYYYSTGGNPGSGANTAAILVGPAPACNTSNFTVVNEVSTIASVYAFGGFISDPLHAGSSGSTLALTALNNAGQTLDNLYSQTTGAALATTQAGNGTVPQSEINTLANILAACVNSTGPGSTPCTTLFSNAENGSFAPTDTATAAVNIAHNPGANIANLYGLQTGTSPFQPMLSAAPNDFTIAISYAGGGLNGAHDIAIDGSGNVWVANAFASDISEFSPAGAALSGSSGYIGGGLDNPQSLAIDGSGNVWALDTAPGSVGLSKLNSSGSPFSASAYSGGGLSGYGQIAIDALGNVWVTDLAASSISEFSSSGSPANSSGFTGGGLNSPTGIAIDVSGHVWASNGSSISEFNSSGSPLSSSGYSGGGLNHPWGVAIDGSGNVWISNTNGGVGGSISEFNSSGSPISGSGGFTGGGLSVPEGLAIDGSGNVWVANEFYAGSVSEFNSSGTAISGASGYQSAGLNQPVGIAIDGSGNVWLTDDETMSITEFVGAATPVVTPVVANLLTPYGSHAVNKP